MALDRATVSGTDLDEMIYTFDTQVGTQHHSIPVIPACAHKCSYMYYMHLENDSNSQRTQPPPLLPTEVLQKSRLASL